MAGPVQVGTSADTFGGNNVTPTLAGVTAGNLLIVTAFGARLGVTSSPPAPAGWTKAINATWVAANFSGYNSGAEIYYKENASSGSNSCSLDMVESNAALRAVMSEWAYTGTSLLDKISSNSAATTGGTSGDSGTTATTSQANELVIAVMTTSNVLQSASSGITDPPAGYASLDVSQTSFSTGCGEACYKEVAATGTQTAAWTWTPTGEWMGVIATFKGAGGGGGNTIAVPAGALTLAAQTPTVVVSNNQTIAVPAGSLTLSGKVPTVVVTANQTVAVPAGSLSLTGLVPTVTATQNNTITVPAGSLTLTGFAPVVLNGNTVQVPAGSLTLTGLAPTIVQSNNQLILVPAGSLALTGNAPTIVASVNQVINVPLGALTLAAFAPTVTVGGGPQLIDVPLAQLIMTAYAPAVLSTGEDIHLGPMGPIYASGGWHDPKRSRLKPEPEEEPEIDEEPTQPVKKPSILCRSRV
jgi:hypothetical protein